MLNQNMIPK
ncbi:hypothetical protein F383_32365 [Gossypium arboreum]|uniref:Uncharacterized protein n=1 Tax=Gossypium arboreum TaxID=29729 RepID=A0A0B0N289_GOSAR|nr:hypothetical protein F383_32365 [Gossypium arboreum]